MLMAEAVALATSLNTKNHFAWTAMTRDQFFGRHRESHPEATNWGVARSGRWYDHDFRQDQ